MYLSMRGHRRSLLLLSLAFTLLVAAALPAYGQGEEATVTLQAEAGFEGKAKTGQWIPVTVQIANQGAEFSGTLEFESRVELGPNRQATTHQYPVAVPAGATKRLTLYMPPAQAVPPIRLMADGQPLAEAQPQVEITWELLLGVLGVEPAELSSLSTIKLGERSTRLIHLTPQNLPTEWITLPNLDAILLNRAAWGELDAQRQAALKGWVEQGGVLVVAGGPEANRLEPLLPWLSTRLEEIDRVNLAGIGTADLARFDLASWRIAWERDGQVLAATRSLGAGSIHLLAFDPALEPFASWSGLPDLIGSLLEGSATLSPLPTGGGSPMAVKGMMLVDSLAQMPLGELPSSRRMLMLLGLYALLIGPVHLLLLRSFRRLGWALLTLPLLSMAGAGTAWAYMAANRGADVSAVTLAVVEGQPGGSSLMVRSVTGFYLPPGAAHEASLGTALLTPLPSPPVPVPGQAYQPTSGQARVTEGRRVWLNPLESWQMRAVSAEAAVPVAATLSGDLIVDGFHVTGSITNGLPYALKDVLVVVGPSFQRVGEIAPGQKVEVSVALPAAQPQQIGPNRIAEAMGRSLEVGPVGPAGPSKEQQAQMRRQQVSWALANILPWAESTQQPKVMLVGWLDSTGLPVQVDGQEVEGGVTALYVQRLAYSISPNEVHLPSDFIDARLVEASAAAVNAPLQWGWSLGAGGSAIIEHTVPPELVARVTEMQLRIPVLDKGGSSTALPLTLQLFRWSDSTWVEKEFPTTAIPLGAAEGFLSPDGRVRLQIGKSEEFPVMLGAPGLSLQLKGVSR